MDKEKDIICALNEIRSTLREILHINQDHYRHHKKKDEIRNLIEQRVMQHQLDIVDTLVKAEKLDLDID